MSKHIGIDLGTANTLACVGGGEIVLREPSVVAVNTVMGKVLAVGAKAKEMIGKTPGEITTYRPLREGVIAEFEITKIMLRMFVKRLASMEHLFLRPDLIVCIPYGVTEVERMAVENAALEAGARTVALIEEPLAAAIGAGLAVERSKGTLVVDIGGGTTEVAVLSLGGTVVSKSVRTAGDRMDDAIIAFIRRKYGVLVGETAAENIKMTVGSVHRYVDRGSITVIGRNVETGLPESVTVGSADVGEALKDIIAELVDTVRKTLEETPPELSGDILDDGITLTGGGALLGGIDRLLSEITGLRVTVAKAPLDCVIRGIGKVIDDMEKYSPMLHYVKYK